MVVVATGRCGSRRHCPGRSRYGFRQGFVVAATAAATATAGGGSGGGGAGTGEILAASAPAVGGGLSGVIAAVAAVDAVDGRRAYLLLRR